MGKSLIIVEDEALIAFDLKLTLERYGYRVLATADSSPAAVDLAQRLNPDAVLMDIMLKGKETGIDAALRIRSFSEAPILFISGNSYTIDVEWLKGIKNSGTIAKPILEQRLLAALSTMTRGPAAAAD